MVPAEECLPSKYEALSSNLNATKEKKKQNSKQKAPVTRLFFNTRF
jgi:hypothetical protein